jgi:hypothetical protein
MMTANQLVDVFVRIASNAPEADPDLLVESLLAANVDSEAAELLVAFVPMAFAHIALARTGVTLQEGFLIGDAQTGRSERGLLQEEPLFLAAAACARRMLSGDPHARELAMQVASGSAEWAAVAQLGGHPSDCVLTEPILIRLPISYLTRRTEKPLSDRDLSNHRRRRLWWRFWERGE